MRLKQDFDLDITAFSEKCHDLFSEIEGNTRIITIIIRNSLTNEHDVVSQRFLVIICQTASWLVLEWKVKTNLHVRRF